MDKLKGVQYRRVVSGHSEPCLKSVGHMTKELLKLKNVHKSFKIVRGVNGQKKKCVQCVSMPSGYLQSVLKVLGVMVK